MKRPVFGMSTIGPIVFATGTLMSFASACDNDLWFDSLPIGALDASGDSRSSPSDASATTPDADADAGLDAESRFECLTDHDCGSTRHVCDRARSLCVECLVGTDCGAKQACEPATKRCVDTCAEGAEVCPRPGFACDEERGRCITCIKRSDCTNDPAGSDCDNELGQCVGCNANADCPLATPVCDRRSGACVACLGTFDCVAGSCVPGTHICR